MDEITRDAIVSIAAFAAIFGILYVYVITRHRERMTMLDKDLFPSAFNSGKSSNAQTLKFGMLSVGIAIGILAGHVLTYYYDVAKSTSFLSMLFLFGGLSLIANYLIVRKSQD